VSSPNILADIFSCSFILFSPHYSHEFFNLAGEKRRICYAKVEINFETNVKYGDIYMLDTCSIFRNPKIPQGYYYVKVIDLQTAPMKGYNQPIVLVKLKLYPNDNIDKDVVMSAVIYPTEKAKYHYLNFLNTFLRNDEKDLDIVMNRWGCVKIYDAVYEHIEYSAVHWIFQLPQAKQCIAKIEEEEAEENK
jgi:hypothetical protein